MVTVAQLKQKAKDLGIKGYSKMKKADLLQALGPDNKPSTEKKGRREFRPGPELSAKNINVGERMMGNDGNVYEIAQNKNGVKRWKKLAKPKEPKEQKVKAPLAKPKKEVAKPKKEVAKPKAVKAAADNGPELSPKNINEGARMMGNDGNLYEVVQNKNGDKRWKKLAKQKDRSEPKVVVPEKKEIKYEDFKQDACLKDFAKKLKQKITPGENLGAGQFGEVYKLCTGEGCGQYVVKESFLGRDKLDKGLDLQFKTEVKCLMGLKNVKAEYKGKKWKCVPTVYGHGYCEKNGEKIGYIIMEPMYKPVTSIKVLWEMWYAYLATLKAGYCHLDSHSGNIMADEKGNPVIIDWGYGWTMKWGKPTVKNFFPAEEWPGFRGTWDELVWSMWDNMSWLWNRLVMEKVANIHDLTEQFGKAAGSWNDPYK